MLLVNRQSVREKLALGYTLQRMRYGYVNRHCKLQRPNHFSQRESESHQHILRVTKG